MRKFVVIIADGKNLNFSARRAINCDGSLFLECGFFPFNFEIAAFPKGEWKYFHEQSGKQKAYNHLK